MIFLTKGARHSQSLPRNRKGSHYHLVCDVLLPVARLVAQGLHVLVANSVTAGARHRQMKRLAPATIWPELAHRATLEGVGEGQLERRVTSAAAQPV
jgi:hypothetical protein